jgi:hypothetical protein
MTMSRGPCGLHWQGRITISHRECNEQDGPEGGGGCDEELIIDIT